MVGDEKSNASGVKRARFIDGQKILQGLAGTLIFVFASFCSVLGQSGDGARTEALVHIAVFTSPECPECVYVKGIVIPELERRYSASLVVRYVDVDEGDNYDLLEALERQHGDTDNKFPVIFCGEEVFGGSQEVATGLERAILACLQSGGCPPILLPGGGGTHQGLSGKSVYLAYFFSTGCQKCGRVERMLLALQRRHPNLTVNRYNLSLSRNKKLAEAMGRHCGLPEHRRLVVPSLFIGQDALVGDEIKESRVRALVEEYQALSAEPIWKVVVADTSRAARGIIRRFQALGILTVVVAGLIDGINPCAFATMIFLISYLTFVGRRRREMLWGGVAFTSAVFLTYLALGLGLFQFLRRFAFLTVLSQIVYGLAAVLVFVLGLISLYDYVLIRRGHKPSDLKLQLPWFLKRRIHSTIRQRSRSEHLVVGAFVTGAVISVLELVCTGQVYLPTIVFVMGVSSLRTHAFFYLFLYNLLFVLPLAFVFLVSLMGVTSQQMGAVMEAHMGGVKLALGLFFLFLCGFLVYILLV